MKGAVMSADKIRYIVLHTLGAAVFIFVLNKIVLGTTMESAILWTVGFGALAGGLAWQHTQR